MTLTFRERNEKNQIQIVLDEDFFRKEFSGRRKDKSLYVTIGGRNSLKHKSAKRFRGENFSVLSNKAQVEQSRELSEIIDLAMQLQHSLFQISSNTLSSFQLQMLLIILEAFVAIVFNCYYILSIFYNPAHFRLPPNEAALFLAYQLLQPIMNLLAITVTCMVTIRATEATQQIVNKLIILTKVPHLRERLSQFSMQIKSSTPVFNILGLFNIDGGLLFSIAASTTTYLVILVQYSEK